MEKLNSNKVLEVANKKIERKKFFIYSGTAILGFLTLSQLPFSLFKSIKSKPQSQKKEASIKITENPNAVKRKSRQPNTGQVNNG